MSDCTSTALRVVGLGAGGHAKVVLEALRAAGGYDVVGFLDNSPELVGRTVLGVPVLGTDDTLAGLRDDGLAHVFIGLGGANDTRPRRRLYEFALSLGLDVVTTIHPSAYVSPSAVLGRGATVLAAAVVNTGAHLGEDVTVNTAAVVEHDCRIGDHAHLATGARLASSVDVGGDAHVGAGATVLQGVRVGHGAVVGAGAVVIDDVEPGMVVVGVPAHPLRRVES